MRRKWSPQSRMLMGLAVVLTLATFLLIRGWTSRVEAMAPGPRVEVWVAARDIPAGTQIGTDDLEASRIPAGWVPGSHVSGPYQVVGRRASGPIGRGEILTSMRISAAAGPVASQVPEGLRAVVVPGDVPAAVVAPGDRVDVMATYSGGQPYTDTVGEALEVLQVLPPTPDGDGAQLVLLADPSAAERLAHARTFAQLSIAVVGARA